MGADQQGKASGRPLVLDSYARLSKNPSGVLEKVEDQHRDNRATIERAGATLGLELTDNSLSAWRPGVRRADWERLLARLESGESDGVAVWHVDRLMRLPRDLERLLEQSDRGATLASTHGSWDLLDPNDRFILRVEVAHACRSSDDASRRIRRRLERLRLDGVAHVSGRAFGFPGLARVAGADGERVAVPDAVVRAEREALRDGTAALLAGASYADVAAEWNAAGVATATGRPWTPNLIRGVLSRPRNAGLIEHDGVVAGRAPGEPIVAPEQFERLRAKLAGRRRGRPPGQRYIGSGLLRCGVCGRKLTGRPHAGTYRSGEPRRQYFCQKQSGGCGKVAADVAAVDRELQEFTTRRLSDPRHAAAIATARAKVADRLAAVIAEIVECEALQEAMSDRVGRREMTLGAFDKANAPLAADLARLTAERDSLTGGPSGLPDAPVPVSDPATVRADWQAGDTAARRVMLTNALGTAALYIDRATPGRRGPFDPGRVRFDPEPA